MKPKLTIIGAGMGDISLLTGKALAKLKSAKRVLASPRIAQAFGNINPGIISASLDEMVDELSHMEDWVALVSGDAGFFSLSSALCEDFSHVYDVELINGLNSLQYFCGRLGAAYDGVKAVSLHGRKSRVVPAVAYNRRVFALTGGENTVAAVLEELKRAGLSGVMAHVGENLSYPGEKITTGAVRELCGGTFSGQAVIMVENDAAVSPFARIRDGDIIRGDAPMTKETVRSVSLARLDVRPADIVWDVGAGTGAMSAALARAAFEGEVYAVEKEPEALKLMVANRERLGAYNVYSVGGAAPQALSALPAPDRVFIGGSSGRLREVLETIRRKSDSCMVCVNAVTLETLHEAVSAFDGMGFNHMEIECVSVAKARQAGAYRMMEAQNPVYVISAAWRREDKQP